jgi:hypothetical protein
MTASCRPALAALLLGGAVCVAACRGVLGIDEDRPSIDTPDAVSPDSDAATTDSERPLNPYCSTLAPPAQRCADFETGDLFTGWDNENKVPNPGLQGGGAFEELLELDGRKLLARTPALVGTGPHASATLLYTIPSVPRRISLRAKLNVLTEDIPAGELVVMALTFGDEGAVLVYRDREGSAIAVVPDGLGAHFPAWAAGAARTIGIVVGTGTGAFARASLDGSWSPELALPAHFGNARQVYVAVGPSADAPMGAAKISIDDVALYWGATE